MCCVSLSRSAQNESSLAVTERFTVGGVPLRHCAARLMFFHFPRKPTEKKSDTRPRSYSEVEEEADRRRSAFIIIFHRCANKVIKFRLRIRTSILIIHILLSTTDEKRRTRTTKKTTTTAAVTRPLAR